MLHIKQKNISSPDNITEEINIYIIVDTTKWVDSLYDHPSIIENPDLFEVIEGEIPESHQVLKYN